jgi:hypothetical protein
MKKCLRRFDDPFFASVTGSGDVALMYETGGQTTPPNG